MILLIDNFDSFTFNLYQALGQLAEVKVVRNDDVPYGDLNSGKFSHVVISPGPGDPTDPAYFGDCRRVIQDFHQKLPILGICLGHQGIGAFFGGKVVRAPQIMHGKTSLITHSGQGLFSGLPAEITVMRYHSLAVDSKTLPAAMIVDAQTEDGTIMAFHHQRYPTFGLQFHPESFATPAGQQLLTNFLKTQI
ncbi:MAG TPA: aminodeoxychorismate/anthranilate synthase component II [Candidatus Saccharimonadales bacterium]|nr:aminodeoxychorismate/anthranilate synthase component II [Candidatus Saccharimonadales bacterium]